MCAVTQSRLTLCDPTDCSPPGSSVRGIFQARILEWVVISYSTGSSQPRDWSCLSCTIYIYPLFFEFLSHSGHQRALSSLCYTVGSQLVINFIHSRVYMSIQISQFIPPSAIPPPQAESVLSNPLGSRATALKPCSWSHVNNQVKTKLPSAARFPSRTRPLWLETKTTFICHVVSQSTSKQQVARAILDTYFFFRLLFLAGFLTVKSTRSRYTPAYKWIQP